MLPAVGADKGLDLPPEHLRGNIVLAAELSPESRERLRFLVTIECAQRAAKLRRLRGKEVSAVTPFEQLAVSAPVLGCGRVVSRKRCDLAQAAVCVIVSAELPPPLTDRKRESPSFVQSTKHGEQLGSDDHIVGNGISRQEGVER